MRWQIRGPLRQVGWWSEEAEAPLPLDAFDVDDNDGAKAAGALPLLVPDEEWR